MLSQRSKSKTETIFPAWHFDHWRAVDDRVRGGSSVSHLDQVDLDEAYNDSLDLEKGGKNKGARFWGELDIETLGGAGFASQAYRYGPTPLQLPPLSYSGISITYKPDPQTKYTSDTPLRFTFILKTTPTSHIPKNPKVPGPPRESQLTYEVHFNSPNPSHSSLAMDENKKEEVRFGWNEFEATYRGRKIEKGDEKWVPLDTNLIYELSIMCRSDFGKQSGKFGIILNEIKAIKKEEENQNVGIWNKVKEFWNGWTSWIWRMFSWNGDRIKLEEDDEEKRLIA